MWSGSVGDFIRLVKQNRLTAVVRRSLEQEGKTVSPSEERAWDISLPAVAQALDGQGLDDRHIEILVEVAMPGTSARADVVLLGTAPNQGRGVVILELKHWGRDVRGAGAELVELGSGTGKESAKLIKLHPCAQVQGYRDYLRLYGAAVVDRTPDSQVHGCTYLHELDDVIPLAWGYGNEAEAVNRALVADCPVFGKNDGRALAGWIRERLPAAPDGTFVEEFKQLKRRASKDVALSLKEVADSNRNPWVLLDEQRVAMRVIEERLQALAMGTAPERQVVIVTGGPGSGKTILAVSTLLKAATDYGLGQSYLVTTSSAQHLSLEGEMRLVKGERLSQPGS